MCVGPQRGLSCAEGDLAAVGLNIESVVLLCVCVTTTMMMMIIIIMPVIMSSPVRGGLFKSVHPVMNIQFVDEIIWFV